MPDVRVICTQSGDRIGCRWSAGPRSGVGFLDFDARKISVEQAEAETLAIATGIASEDWRMQFDIRPDLIELALARINNEIPLRQVAAAVGVSPAEVSNWERGVADPTPVAEARWRQAVNV